MKRILLTAFVLTLLFQLGAQSQVIKVTTTEGSYNILRDYFQHHIRFPAIAIENDIAGEVIVSFIIDRDQRLTDIKLVKGLFANCDSEVVQKVNDYNVYKKGIELKPQKYTIAVNFITIREKDEKRTKDTINKAALKKTDTDRLLQINIIGRMFYRKPEVVY